MQPSKQLEDRRLSHRVSVCGVAVLRCGDGSVLCRIADLSTGGIGLRTEDMRGAARLSVGDVVAIDLQLDPRQAPRASHDGTVRHVDASGRIGIAFTECPALLQDPQPAASGSGMSLRVVEGGGAVRRAAFRWRRRS